MSAIIKFLRFLLKSGNIETVIYDDIKEFVAPFNFNQDNFKVAYTSSLDEHLIFLDKGIITDRYELIYLPYKNIDSVTKELCGGGLLSSKKTYLITVKTNIDRQGTKIIILDNNKTASEEKREIKKCIEFDRGLVVLESMGTEFIGNIDTSFKNSGISVREIPCNPK